MENFFLILGWMVFGAFLATLLIPRSMWQPKKPTPLIGQTWNLRGVGLVYVKGLNVMTSEIAVDSQVRHVVYTWNDEANTATAPIKVFLENATLVEASAPATTP